MRAFINYVSHPTNAKEFGNKFKECNELDMECLLNNPTVCWTVARHAQPDDIILFIHTRSAEKHIQNIEKEMNEDKKYEYLTDFLLRSKEIYKKYGGTICAIGEVWDMPHHFDNFGYENHFKSRHFAEIGNIYILENPIDTIDISNILDIRQHYSSTPLKCQTFDKLREVIQSKNKTPEYFNSANICEELEQTPQMKFPQCYHIPLAGEIAEEYEVYDNQILANISETHLKDMIVKFVETLEEPCFFILETPLKLNEEKKIKDSKEFHHHVYYIDGVNRNLLLDLIDSQFTSFRKEGLISFGVASHSSHDELFVTKYNIIRIFSKNIEKYNKFMGEFDIKKSTKIKTAWDTFNQELPGQAFASDDGEINKFVEFAKEHYGLYEAEIR